MTNTDRLSDRSHVGRVALRVRSLEETLPFYRDVVGLTVHERSAERATGRATLGADDAFLVLVEEPDAAERGPREAGLFHVAIRVPTRAALGAALERIAATDALDGASDHAVSEALYCSDPEGNGVEVYCDRPQSEWPITEDGAVDMVTEPMDYAGVRDASDGGEVVPDGTDVGHVHLEVTDVDAAGDFYVDALGMNRRASYGTQALFVAAGDYHHHIGLNTWNGRTQPADEETLGLAWYELVVPDQKEREHVVGRLGEHGADVHGDDAVGDDVATGGTATVVDPSGIQIRIRVADEG